jgi:hypothetical protein
MISPKTFQTLPKIKTMKNQNFPAFVFLTALYCIGFAIIALVLLVVRLMRTSESSSVVSAQSLAPIFERECAESPSEAKVSSTPEALPEGNCKHLTASASSSHLDSVSFGIPAMSRKSRARASKFSALIMEEVARLDKAML